MHYFFINIDAKSDKADMWVNQRPKFDCFLRKSIVRLFYSFGQVYKNRQKNFGIDDD